MFGLYSLIDGKESIMELIVALAVSSLKV